MSANNSSLVLSEVKAREEELQPLQEQGFLLTRVKDYWRGLRFAGMPVNYAQTLGEDRLIQAWYIYKQKKIPTLLIDAGTFTTMDVISTKGFEGGYIIPGFATYSSTFLKGEQLKETGLDSAVSASLPHATAEAMRDSYFAFAALAQRLITEHQIERVILTGGRSSFWKEIRLINSLIILLIVDLTSLELDSSTNLLNVLPWGSTARQVIIF